MKNQTIKANLLGLSNLASFLLCCFSAFVIMITPILESHIFPSNSSLGLSRSSAHNSSSHSKGFDHFNQRSESKSESGESEKEVSDTFESESELLSYYSKNLKNLNYKYGLRILNHIQQYVLDGYPRKLYRPPALS